MFFKIKHLQLLVAVALCVISAFAFASCSNDDDEPDSNSLAGTSWTILSDVDDADGDADEEMV